MQLFVSKVKHHALKSKTVVVIHLQELRSSCQVGLFGRLDVF